MRQFLSIWKYQCVMTYKNKREGFTQLALFLFVRTTCFGRRCRLQKLFCTDIDLTEQNFQVWIEMFSNYSSLKYGAFILAFQLQFGIYEAESIHFRWEKEKRYFNDWFSRKVGLLYFGDLAVDRFLKPVFKEILNNLYVFKAATYVE